MHLWRYYFESRPSHSAPFGHLRQKHSGLAELLCLRLAHYREVYLDQELANIPVEPLPQQVISSDQELLCSILDLLATYAW